MANLYFLMALLYLALAALATLDASLVSLQLLPWFNGLRWLRVHFITVGVLAQFAFGLLPALVAARSGRPRPPTRWGIWLALNAGFITLLAGIPLVNGVLIAAGGTLVFLATAGLVVQLQRMRPALPGAGSLAGRRYYIAALGYLLLGVFLGTGLWLGWGPALGLASPKEVHVHANLWGFAALLFAGLLIDLYPGFAGRPLAWPRGSRATFWLLTLGALGLVAGPWLAVELLSAIGLLLHTAGTLWLLASAVRPLLGDRRAWTPGVWHLLTAYLWFLVPAAAGPLIVYSAPGFPVAEVTGSGGPILVYGWMLQFGYAVIPYLYARAFLPGERAALGGTWLSLLTIHAGGVLYWSGLFLSTYQAALHGIAFGLWLLSLAPVIGQLWRITRAGLARLESRGAVLAEEPIRGP